MLAAGTKGNVELHGAVIAAILAVMAVTLALFLLAQEIHQLIGVTARKVIVRVFGVLLAAHRGAIDFQRPERGPYLRLSVVRGKSRHPEVRGRSPSLEGRPLRLTMR